MRNVLVAAAAVAVVLVAMVGLRWLGLVTHDAAVVGFVTGIAVAVVILVANAKKASG
jgi:membrane associated rhomboid family serine protease